MYLQERVSYVLNILYRGNNTRMRVSGILKNTTDLSSRVFAAGGWWHRRKASSSGEMHRLDPDLVQGPINVMSVSFPS